MKVFPYGVAMVLTVALASPALARRFDVCVNPATDVVPDDAGAPGFPTAGDGFVAVGIIVPGGTIPDGGVPSCSSIAGERIGTFFARGRIVAGLPNAASDDLAYVDWQFRIDGKGAIDTSGPVKTTRTYQQTIVGATGGLRHAKGRALVKVLNADGFQFRLVVPENTGQEN
jgi:hypothetical protein